VTESAIPAELGTWDDHEGNAPDRRARYILRGKLRRSKPHVSVDVCRDGSIEALKAPEKLIGAILNALRYSQKSSQENPTNDWGKVCAQPNWIHARFSPPKLLLLNGGKSDGATAISEILIVFPTGDGGRRWPDYILLKTDVGTLSQAKWSACEMREIVTAAAFDPRREAFPFNTHCVAEH
jgi:hypothetical protein